MFTLSCYKVIDVTCLIKVGRWKDNPIRPKSKALGLGLTANFGWSKGHPKKVGPFSVIQYTLLKKFKGAHTLWQITVKTDIPSFDTKIQKN